MDRFLPAILGFLASALLVVGALLPEFEAGGVAVAQVDSGRVGWVPSLVGMLVQVGLVLSGALMLAMGESRRVAGGLLLGAGILGFTLRMVRLLQIGEAAGIDAALGSYVDLAAEALTAAAGIVALRGSGEQEPEDEEDYEELPVEVAPPPGDQLPSDTG